MRRSWLYIFTGGCLEIVWVSGLKHASAFLEWLVTAGALAASFYLILQAARRLPIGTVYAVFTGLGTAGTVMAEMVIFGEPFSWPKVLLTLLLLSGIVGLKLVTDSDSVKRQGGTA